MTTIVQGRIVYALDSIPDPQGRNAKPNRPFVVVSITTDIQVSQSLTLLAISTGVYGKPEEVEIPNGPNCVTRLRQQSAVMCNWEARVPVVRGQDNRREIDDF